ncbi:DUF1636 domain-containing protein [Nodosilinea sp. LEGE 06152]|uniref:DUF1636 domain-containing protein n=1 Tax=Nodosilinea sp. LEGE 06152 TaxID=2777966 RepID=UPI00187F8516|nr:DUF1636 domain-containing protein [Nodosilinea sp. LEGE 06152]MBE9156980.1 DUF1636 domain-containing protein [Nodosilinea sp. LEGE 06152]
MPKYTFFVCESCQFSEEEPEGKLADGTRLLKQLNRVVAEQSQSDKSQFRPVVCLWTCDCPRAITFPAPIKPTYLFNTLPTDETAPALRQFGQLYLNSNTGSIPWKQLPEMLQSASIAKIPAVER